MTAQHQPRVSMVLLVCKRSAGSRHAAQQRRSGPRRLAPCSGACPNTSIWRLCDSLVWWHLNPFSSRHCLLHIWQYQRSFCRPFAFWRLAICGALAVFVRTGVLAALFTHVPEAGLKPSAGRATTRACFGEKKSPLPALPMTLRKQAHKRATSQPACVTLKHWKTAESATVCMAHQSYLSNCLQNLFKWHSNSTEASRPYMTLSVLWPDYRPFGSSNW